MRALALVLLVAYSTSACFAYVPAGGADAPRRSGDGIRVYLSPPQTIELEEVTAGNITVVEGEAVQSDNGTLVVSAWRLWSGSGAEFAAEGRSVHLPVGAVERVEQRRLSWLRTGGIVALGLLAGVLFAQAEGGYSGDGGRPQPPGTGK